MQNILLFIFLLLAPFLTTPLHVIEQTYALKPVYIKGRWGYATPDGKVAIEARFDAALPFSKGLARVGVVDEELPEIDGRPNLLWGFVNESGRVMVELRYNVLRDFSEGVAACALVDPALAQTSALVRRGTDNFRWGYVDREGRIVIPIQYFAAGDFSEGLSPVDVGGEKDTVCGPPHKYGYVDKTGTFIIKPQFASAGSFKNGSAGASVGRTEYVGRCVCCAPRFIGKYGHVNRAGEFVVEGVVGGDDSFPELDRSEQSK
jgi:hypothetical protein